jgi:hypothetical protein
MALNDHILIAAINRVDEAAAAFTAGSEVATLPATQLRRRELSRVWRTADVTAPDQTDGVVDRTAGRTWLEVDLGAGYTLGIVSLIGNNISQSGYWRVRLSNDADFDTLAWDSGPLRAWAPVVGYGVLPWGVWSWGDVIGATEASFYTVDSHALLDVQVTARYVRIDIMDDANAAGFVQVGRLYAGPYYQPSVNVDYGLQIEVVDASAVEAAWGGTIYSDERTRYRVLRVQASALGDDEVLANILDYMDRRKGVIGDMVVIPRPLVPRTWLHEAIYCRQQSTPAIVQIFENRRARPLIFEELR